MLLSQDSNEEFRTCTYGEIFNYLINPKTAFDSEYELHNSIKEKSLPQLQPIEDHYISYPASVCKVTMFF